MEHRIQLAVVILVVAALVIMACGPSAPAAVPENNAANIEGFAKNSDGYADITTPQLAELMENKDFTLVNVHIPYEGEIPQTDLSIPYDEISSHLDQLPDRDSPIVLYCRSGSMSTAAARELVSLGYTNVLEVDGGFSAWQAAGYELLDKDR
jgi:rhodanese-related sulfurtransferase